MHKLPNILRSFLLLLFVIPLAGLSGCASAAVGERTMEVITPVFTYKSSTKDFRATGKDSVPATPAKESDALPPVSSATGPRPRSLRVRKMSDPKEPTPESETVSVAVDPDGPDAEALRDLVNRLATAEHPELVEMRKNAQAELDRITVPKTPELPAGTRAEEVVN